MIQFLDHSTVSLVSSNAEDAQIARAAWVSQSYDSREKDTGRIEGLINFLYKNKHMSPFEHSHFTFYVQTPIFVMREIHRHRTSAYNEMSGRYSELKPIFYRPSERLRPMVQSGKIGSYTFENGNPYQTRQVFESITRSSEETWAHYQHLLDIGIAREVARDVLPLNIFTESYMTISARNLMHFLGLRTASDALYEIQDVARQMEEHFMEKMPLTYKAYINNKEVV